MECDFEAERTALQMKLFSSVAHDFKTPLACIIGSLSTLDQMADNLSPQQIKVLLSSALSEAHRLDDFVSQMLEKIKP